MIEGWGESEKEVEIERRRQKEGDRKREKVEKMTNFWRRLRIDLDGYKQLTKCQV